MEKISKWVNRNGLIVEATLAVVLVVTAVLYFCSSPALAPFMVGVFGLAIVSLVFETAREVLARRYEKSLTSWLNEFCEYAGFKERVALKRKNGALRYVGPEVEGVQNAISSALAQIQESTGFIFVVYYNGEMIV